MKNFALNDLILVDPCEIGDEAYKRAKHGFEILENANIIETFDKAIKNLDVIVGTTGIKAGNVKRPLRQYLCVDEFVNCINEINGNVGLVFGRENYGLYNDELKQCDLIVNIPTNDIYPILNLSHSACIIFYELYKSKPDEKKRREASGMEKELFYKNFDKLLDVINYPEHKRENTKLMFRRVLGRAMLSKWEFHSMMGVIRNAIENVGK